MELGCGTISHAYTKPSMSFNFRVLQPPTKNAKLKTPRNFLPVRYLESLHFHKQSELETVVFEVLSVCVSIVSKQTLLDETIQ